MLKSLLFSLLVSSIFTLTAQSNTLSISIPNVKNTDGKIKLAIYNSAESFPKKKQAYKALIISIDSIPLIIKIPKIPNGAYAIALFHDENGDGVFNKNFLGIPQEAYGFSNDAPAYLSAPSFEDCKFIVNKDKQLIINLNY